MIMSCKLAWANMVRNPVRSALTATAMVASAAIVAWMVAGYDSILAEAADKPEDLIGCYDLLLSAGGRFKPTLSSQLIERLNASPSVHAIATFAAFDVNLQTERQGTGVGSRARNGQPAEKAPAGSSRPDKVGGRRGTDAAAVQIAPPTYGLPRRGTVAVASKALSAPLAMSDGRWLDSETTAAAAPEAIPCVLGEALAKRLKLAVGQRFPLGSSAGSFTLHVQGIMADGPPPHKLRALARENEQLALPRPDSIFVSWTDGERIAGGALQASYALIMLTEQGRHNFTALWREQFDAAQARLINDDDVAQALRAGDSHSHLRMQAYAATGITMLVSFFIIFSSLSMGVEERVRQFAILRAVALARSQLAKVVLVEGLLFGLIGWLGGLISGRLLLLWLPALSGSPGRSNAATAWRIGFWTIFLTGFCAIVGSLAASLYPAWRATRVKPLDAITPPLASRQRTLPARLLLPAVILLAVNPLLVFLPNLPEELRIRLYGFVGCPAMTVAFILLAPAAYSLTQRLFAGILSRLLGLQAPFLVSQCRANLWRGAGTVMAISVGLGLYMTAVIWSASLLKPFLPGDWLPDMFATIIPGGLVDDDMSAVQAVAGIDAQRCLPVAVEQVLLAQDLTGSRQRQNVVRQDNVVFFGLDSARAYAGDTPLLPFRFSRGSDREKALAELASDGNACLIPRHFAEIAQLTVGDLFAVIPPDAPTSLVEYRVAGIIELKGWHWFSKFSGTRRHSARTAAMLFADSRSVRRSFNLSRVNYLWFDLQPDSDQQHIKAELERIANNKVGQLYHIPGRGDVPIQRNFVRLTATTDLRQSILDRTETIVAGMLRLPMLLLLVTSLAVANTAAAALRSRRWEMGVMRAVGLSSGAMARLILGEALMIGLAAGVLSLSFGIFSGLCSAQMATHLSFFGGMGWNLALPWLQLGKGLGITLALCFAAALIPALCVIRTWPLSLLQDGPRD
ncbi:MAG: ABC transporter permease [Lentisphaeria bacterium]|jgi:putative ABC transport system permease protein